MADTFPQIRAAAIDERAYNVYYRQTQLERLCKTLIDNANKIRDAIATDYDHNPAEIAVELNLAIGAVRRDYASLQPKQAHEDEYAIAAGNDASAYRKPAGVVYIEPCTHTLFYSVVVPLSAAIAAGDCVVVLLENNIRAVSSLLRQLLHAALDSDTFAIASSSVTDQSLLDSAIIVNQNASERWPQPNHLSSPAESRTVAVVDRTSDIQLAARELVAARFGFGGRSPYAPDIVFVNEFAKQSFLQAVVGETVKLASASTRNGNKKAAGKASSTPVSESIESLRKADSNLRVILQEPSLAVVELTSRDSGILSRKLDVPVLIVHAIRSLDDAIDTINSTSSEVPSLAAYHFANPASGKYLTQFIDANASFVNNFPREILVGPAFPAGHPINPAVRYPVELFSVPRPAFTKLTTSSAALEAALTPGSAAAIQKLLAEATQPLAVMKRSEGGGVGFFEQGFLMNAALILTTTVSVSGVGIWWLVKHGRRLW